MNSQLRPLALSGAVLSAALLGAPPALAEGSAPEAWAARAVLEDYYGAIAERDYRAAYDLWADEGAASGLSFDDFARGYSETASMEIFTGPTEAEGAAGSLFATVPVRVEAELSDGTAQRFAGSYQLRRINDVPGSSAEARRWHIVSADLREVAPLTAQ